MPLQPRYETEYYQPSCENPCNPCVPPCNPCAPPTNPCNSPTLYKVQPNCDTQSPCEDIEPCPEIICEDIYYPEVHYEPIPQNLTCCVEKPKKSLWQQLFGDRCCFKKNCGCKTKKKQKNKPVHNVGCKPCPIQSRKPCRPGCQCASDQYNCPRRGCFPTPKAVCGCHFYFNVENRPKRGRSPDRKAKVAVKGPTNIRSEVIIDGAPNNMKVHEGLTVQAGGPYDNLTGRYGNRKRSRSPSPTNPAYRRRSRRSSSPEYMYSNGNGGKSIRKYSPGRDYKPCKIPSPVDGSPGNTRKVCRVSREGTGQFSPSSTRKSDAYRYTAHCVERSSSQDNIHIGVTLTKEEVRYYRGNKTDSPSPVLEDISSNKGKNVVSDESNDSSDKILTLEIHNSGTKVKQNKDLAEYKEDAELFPNDDSYRRSKVPHSESYKRELEPLLIKKSRPSELLVSSMNDTDNSSSQIEEIQFRPTSMAKSHKRSMKNSLDSRVSEILKKLHNIEEKINDIEQKWKDNKDIRIDFDGQKSTVSVHFKGAENKKCDDNNDSGDSLNKSISKGTVIEIRRGKLKSRSPAKKTSLPPVNDSYTPNCMEFGKKNKPAKPKIVIKLPNTTTTNNRCATLPNDESPVYPKTDNKQSVTWCQVADNLKLNSSHGTCYCLACMSKEKGS